MANHIQDDPPGPEAPEPPADSLEDFIDIGQSLLDQGLTLGESLFRTWNLYQIGIAIAVLAVAHILRAILGPPIRNWMGQRENWPKWRMRILVVIHQRLRAIFFVALIWAIIWIMREVTWPSRSYLLAIIATLATAWLAVVFATRLIQSPLLRKLVRYGATIWVTLHILGLKEEAARLLDSLGFSIGELRISLLLVVQAAAVLGLLVALRRFRCRARSEKRGSRPKTKISALSGPRWQELIVKVRGKIAGYGRRPFMKSLHAGSVGIDAERGGGLAVLSGCECGDSVWALCLQKVVSEPCVGRDHAFWTKSIRKPGDVNQPSERPLQGQNGRLGASLPKPRSTQTARTARN